MITALIAPRILVLGHARDIILILSLAKTTTAVLLVKLVLINSFRADFIIRFYRLVSVHTKGGLESRTLGG